MRTALAPYIPMPGIDAAELARQIQQQQGSLLDVFNLLAGGAIGRMAIFALGIMPYISASIIIQLMTTVSPTAGAVEEGRARKRGASRSTNTRALWHGDARGGAGLGRLPSGLSSSGAAVVDRARHGVSYFDADHADRRHNLP